MQYLQVAPISSTESRDVSVCSIQKQTHPIPRQASSHIFLARNDTCAYGNHWPRFGMEKLSVWGKIVNILDFGVCLSSLLHFFFHILFLLLLFLLLNLLIQCKTP